VKYALGLCEALGRYTDDGRLEIDNNAAERAFRVVALGRKNFLFAGSDAGGERAAVLYSLIGTAKLNGLDPETYLRDVLSRIADHPINRIEELLPWNVAAPSPDHPSGQK
jgi:transposase